ncbi:hypothetical protein BC830DRAFT_869683 [Chytriomyces sp. MP71]|nr:hypothetical protein BC830DRAFT_869683 [Chytriomyces sp. MP71]
MCAVPSPTRGSHYDLEAACHELNIRNLDHFSVVGIQDCNGLVEFPLSYQPHWNECLINPIPVIQGRKLWGKIKSNIIDVCRFIDVLDATDSLEETVTKHEHLRSLLSHWSPGTLPRHLNCPSISQSNSRGTSTHAISETACLTCRSVPASAASSTARRTSNASATHPKTGVSHLSLAAADLELTAWSLGHRVPETAFWEGRFGNTHPFLGFSRSDFVTNGRGHVPQSE